MWTTNQLGMAVWDDGESKWHVDARGGAAGIGLIANAREASDATASDATASDATASDAAPGAARYVSFNPVDQDFLPSAGEQYVRGDCWHVNYPQGDSSYALRLALLPIETAKDWIVLEATISIQTDLLDTHPKLDVDVLCQSIDSLVPTDLSGDDEVESIGSAPISIAVGSGHHTSVLLGPHDSPFTTNHSTDSLLRLRLFGDFLEKGVIRKARPWIIIDRSGSPPNEQRLEALWKQLCGSPLPLTP